jgi:hypothetical protein
MVRAPARDRLEDAREVARVVLAVAIDVDGGFVVLVARDVEPGPERRAEPSALRMGDHAGAQLFADLGRGVGRAVVDEQCVHAKPARFGGDRTEDMAHSRLLVPRDHNREAPLPPAFRRKCPALCTVLVL